MFADQTVANNSCTTPAVPAGLKLPDHPSGWGGDGAHQAASEATNNAIAWQRGGQHHKPPPSSLPRLHGLRRSRRCGLLHGLHRLLHRHDCCGKGGWARGPEATVRQSHLEPHGGDVAYVGLLLLSRWFACLCEYPFSLSLSLSPSLSLSVSLPLSLSLSLSVSFYMSLLLSLSLSLSPPSYLSFSLSLSV
jgi:hypothetical protein